MKKFLLIFAALTLFAAQINAESKIDDEDYDEMDSHVKHHKTEEITKDRFVHIASAKRSILRKLRGDDDFAHPGGAEAIDYALKKIKNQSSLKQGKTLDVGCGYGGSTEYLSKKGFRRVWGADIDKKAVEYSALKYTNLHFKHLDNLNIASKFKKDLFSFIYMFNFMYTIEDKELLIKNIGKISTKGATLVILDYSRTHHLQDPKSNQIKDFAGITIKPIDQTSLAASLKSNGWKVKEISNVTDKYISWYSDFLEKYAKKRHSLIKKYNEHEVEVAENLFNKILFNLKNHNIGAILIIAQKE
ncbi:MAG: methyltransferase domain-containing protein [Rickettsiaceae bacterium]|nr:methyltransferase domain-containing protein [Rickettsiaceae bacterium]